ncbi:MAG: universal stress protein [SAR202 cluster bacterium]|nr:universal stress protein [SAR202 cluster bacterium]
MLERLGWDSRRRAETFKKILVPLDGSEQARGILPYVSYLAKGMGSSLHILSVINPDDVRIPGVARKAQSDCGAPMAVGYTGIVGAETDAGIAVETRRRFPTRVHEPGGPYVSQAFDRAESRLRRDLSWVVDDLAESGLKARAAVRFGDAAEEIVRYAKKHECDLIAMSTHGRNMVSRAILGNITDSVIRTSDLPTLAITPEKAEQYWRSDVELTKILVPLDGSEMAEGALPFAEELARTLSMEIVLVRAIGQTTLQSSDVALFYAGDAGIDAEIEAEACAYLDSVVDKLSAKGLKVTCTFKRGVPAAAINELAHDTPDNVIALTTHGRSGFRRLALGSVTEAIVRNAGDSVLVIPPACSA